MEADEFYGDPTTSSCIQESDFAPYKPKCDIILAHAVAYAPEGKPHQRWPVGIRIGEWQKMLAVIYAAGYQHAEWLPPKAFFFNGQQWFELKLPEVAERIVNMYVESDERIWMCGSNGTLLLGNARDGFKSLSTVDDNQLFSSICKFQDKMYLASNLGLFVYDPKDHKAGIQKVTTDLAPDLQDANVVDSYDKVLWSIGPKDIARFDGKKWERIHHPDNPRIGEE